MMRFESMTFNTMLKNELNQKLYQIVDAQEGMNSYIFYHDVLSKLRVLWAKSMNATHALLIYSVKITPEMKGGSFS